MPSAIPNHPIPAGSTVGIVGAGAMGAGIAQVAASAGHPVLLFDSRREAAEAAIEKTRGDLAKRVERGKLSQEAADATLKRIALAKSLDELRDCSLVIEAIVEDLETKLSLFRELEAIVGDDAILATNTSSLSVTKLASVLAKPERFGGMHFFNPTPAMALVEVVSGLRTSPETAATIYETAKAWGKQPVSVKNAPGFIVNRCARPFYSEPLKFVEEGGADFATVDALFRANGFRMGPFELIDLVGLDVNLAVSRGIWEAYYGEPRYRPSRLVEERVAAGWLGKKSGRGFYDYGEAPQQCPSLHQQPQPSIESPFAGDDRGVIARTICLLINEGFETVLRNIASREDTDQAMRLGLNFPAGPFEWCSKLGARDVLKTLDLLHNTFGDDLYRASILLREEAANA